VDKSLSIKLTSQKQDIRRPPVCTDFNQKLALRLSAAALKRQRPDQTTERWRFRQSACFSRSRIPCRGCSVPHWPYFCTAQPLRTHFQRSDRPSRQPIRSDQRHWR